VRVWAEALKGFAVFGADGILPRLCGSRRAATVG
jgi:hypothetical protein